MSRSPTLKVCLFLVSLLVFYLVPEPSGAFVVQVNGDRITVNAEKTPLQEILLKLSYGNQAKGLQVLCPGSPRSRCSGRVRRT